MDCRFALFSEFLQSKVENDKQQAINMEMERNKAMEKKGFENLIPGYLLLVLTYISSDPVSLRRLGNDPKAHDTESETQ